MRYIRTPIIIIIIIHLSCNSVSTTATIRPSILGVRVMSSPSCWRALTKGFSLAYLVYGTNVASMSFTSHSLGNACTPRIDFVSGDKLSHYNDLIMKLC
jgi:hypothetical protein